MGFEIRFPDAGPRGQAEETVIVEHDDGRTEEMRIHDYDRVYAIPGLYEAVVQDRLECRSPDRIADLLAKWAAARGRHPGSLRVLDIGAGNGVVAEKLAERGFGFFVGLDNVPEAAEATERDRPGLYEEFLAADLLELPDSDRERLERYGFDAMVCVGALGLGHVAARAFAAAANLISDGGAVAFTIKEGTLDADGPDAELAGRFGAWVSDGSLDVLRRESFQHRLSTAGEPIRYEALLAEKTRPLSLG